MGARDVVLRSGHQLVSEPDFRGRKRTFVVRSGEKLWEWEVLVMCSNVQTKLEETDI